jgi:hypothetical protein
MGVESVAWDDRLQVVVRDPEIAADLQEWMSAHGYDVSTPNGEAMGPSDLVIIAIGSLAVLRTALVVLIEWIRSRRTTAELRVGRNLLKLSTSADPESVLRSIEQHAGPKESP